MSKKVLSISRIKAEIAKRAKAFKSATQAGKRVLIAQDVLDQLKLRKLRATSGAFVDSYILTKMFEQSQGYEDITSIGLSQHGQKMKKLANESIQELLISNKIPSCKVCALGGLMVSCTLFNNQEKISDFETDFANMGSKLWHGKRFKNGLSRVFSPSQLNMIEAAFERGYGYFDSCLTILSEEVFTTCAAFGRKYPSDSKRLVAIMKNIIANKGTFIP